MKAIKYTFYGAAILMAMGTAGHLDTHPYAPIADTLLTGGTAAALATAGWLTGKFKQPKSTVVEVEVLDTVARRIFVNPYDQYRVVKERR